MNASFLKKIELVEEPNHVVLGMTTKVMTKAKLAKALGRKPKAEAKTFEVYLSNVTGKPVIWNAIN
jgi:hypothetical protein